MLDIAKVEP